MSFFKRIVSLPEKFFFEISIESIQIALPVDCFLQITVKRNQKKKEKTAKYPYSPSSHHLNLDSRLTFPVTLYKTSSGYTEKLYFFRLVQITSKRSLKNGKGSFNISNLLKSSPLFLSLPLKGCSDPKASLNLTLNLSKIIKTESLNICPIKSQLDYRGSKSFDYSPEALSQEKKMKNREKYLRRIEKVNSFHNSPMSAVILQESDVSSCGSPGSPIRFLDSPEKNKGNDGGFSINPIKIHFDPDSPGFNSPENDKNWEKFIDSEKNSPVKMNNSGNLHEISEESMEIDKNLDLSLNDLEKNQRNFDYFEKINTEDEKSFEFQEKDLSGVKTDEEIRFEAESSNMNDKNIDRDSEFYENIEIEKKRFESNSAGQSEETDARDKNIQNEEIPKNCYSETQPNCNSKKELNNVEISSNENQEKCCRCFIV